MVLFDVELGKLTLVATSELDERGIGAAEHGENDRVRSGHVLQRQQVKRRGRHLHDGADPLGQLAQLVKVDQTVLDRAARLLDKVQILLANGKERNYRRLNRLALEQLAILEHVPGESSLKLKS